MWNFYNKDKNTPYTGNIRIKKNNIIGTILAPSANIIVDTTINASVISNEVSNPGGEIHKSQFNQSRIKRRISCYNSIQKVEPGIEKIKININKIDKNTSKNLENIRSVSPLFHRKYTKNKETRYCSIRFPICFFTPLTLDKEPKQKSRTKYITITLSC